MNPYLAIYETLYDFYGPQNWWPAETPLEMIVGAVLTQNTSWKNVEKCMTVLKEKGLLTVDFLSSLSHEELASLIHSAGYYNLKAKRLKNLLHMIVAEYDGDLRYFLEDDLFSSRDKLLQVKGIGEETADAILLYAGQHPVFVVDAYTHRIFSRHNFLEEECSYSDIQEIFMNNLPVDVSLYNNYHALIVRLAKDYCKKNKPLCEKCPLKGM